MSPLQEQAERAERLGLAEAKAGLSGIVSRVERGGRPCVIMRYGKPAALIVALPGTASRSTRARGVLSALADDNRRAQEQGAFERAMVAKHADAS